MLDILLSKYTMYLITMSQRYNPSFFQNQHLKIIANSPELYW